MTVYRNIAGTAVATTRYRNISGSAVITTRTDNVGVIRGAGFLVFGGGDLNQTYTQTGLNSFAASTHGNWVTFNPYWMYSTNLSPGSLQSTGGESMPDSDLITAIGWARAAGLKIMLKPMIDPLTSDSTGTWRAYCDPGTGGIAAFMSSYNTFISHYATIAATYNIDMFCVGCELNTLVSGPGGSGTAYLPYWTAGGGVIPTVQAIYSGPLIYAGYPTDPPGLWTSLPYLGWDLYPSMIANQSSGTSNVSALETALTTPTAQSGSTSYIAQLAAFSAANGNKPVVITETGFVNATGSAFYGTTSTTPAPAEQSAAIQALVSTLEGGNYSWYAGMFIWGWFCHYYQVNGNYAWNMYGNLAATELGVLW